MSNDDIIKIYIDKDKIREALSVKAKGLANKIHNLASSVQEVSNDLLNTSKEVCDVAEDKSNQQDGN